MNKNWYLVKRNWPQTVSQCPAYAGVGGDIWPLDAVEGRDAQAIHAALLASRNHVQVGEHVELLCTDHAMAELYWAETQRRLGDAWLLEITESSLDVGPDAGVGLGFSSGGFSLVETELIIQGLSGPPLNKWGLIHGMNEGLAYLQARLANDDLEEADDVVVVSVRVLHPGNSK